MTAAATKTKKLTREEWLLKAVELLRPIFAEKGYYTSGTPHALAQRDAIGMTEDIYSFPMIVRVSVGFPSRGGLSNKKRTIGQCWHGSGTSDGIPHIFISPTLDAALSGDGGALVTLVHELCHAIAPATAKHGPKFQRVWKTMGFEGKPTCDHAGESLVKILKGIAKQLGPYPHKALVPPPDMKPQTTRLLKLECRCGRIIRATRKVLDAGGSSPNIRCGVCERQFVEVVVDDADDE
jgi:hypothetical protein